MDEGYYHKSVWKVNEKLKTAFSATPNDCNGRLKLLSLESCKPGPKEFLYFCITPWRKTAFNLTETDLLGLWRLLVATTALANYHKLSGLKLHPLFITQFAGEKSGYVVHGFLTQRLTSQLKVSVSCILMWSPQVCGRIWFLTFIGLRSPFPSWLIVKGSS